MQLKAWINGVDYPIEDGCGVEDELNETLDSGTIRLPHIANVLSVKPYDDVYVHSADLDISNVARFQTMYSAPSGKYYHHFLVGQPSYEMVYADGGRYNYTITLLSEAKGLEKVIMPNRTITQPKIGSTAPRRSIWATASEWLASYCPQSKVGVGDHEWEYRQKYILDPSLQTRLSAMDAPETQLSSPTLRQALTQLFLTFDCLPVVHDCVITALDISARGSLLSSINGRTWCSWSMDGESYCDRIRRGYSNALSKDNTATFVEKMGFRCSDASTMTLENMRLEFSHPIYKIKTMYLCHYAKFSMNGEDKVKLVKYDITPIILQNAYRNLLSEDWQALQAYNPTTTEDLAKYKICTLGYDIGDRYITGWGEKYNYPVGWWKQEKTFFENILSSIVDGNSVPIYIEDLVQKTDGYYMLPITGKNEIMSPATNPTEWIDNATSVVSGVIGGITFDPITAYVTHTVAHQLKSWIVDNVVGTFTQKMKTLFFECEYEGFIDGAVIISKDLHDGDIVQNDNTSSQLTVVETDGLFEKEKANRLGNSALVVHARVNSLSDIHDLGDYDADDNIIYKRTINFQKDYFDVTYYMCADYVLKNYYTSVWAKLRPFALASYEESVRRDENRTLELLLSSEHSYHQNTSKQMTVTDDFYSYLVSFFEETEYDGHTFDNDGHINISKIKDYLVDTQCFTCGNALCFSLPMVDNIVGGEWINRINPQFSEALWDMLNYDLDTRIDNPIRLNDITGSLQTWYWFTNDTESGYADNLEFSVNSVDKDNIDDVFLDNEIYKYGNGQGEVNENTIWLIGNDGVVDQSKPYGKILALPKTPVSTYDLTIKSTISHKDGKERINAIFEVEPIVGSEDIRISPLFLGMSNLNGNAKKFLGDNEKPLVMIDTVQSCGVVATPEKYFRRPMLAICFPQGSSLSQLVGTNLNQTFTFGNSAFDASRYSPIQAEYDYSSTPSSYVIEIKVGLITAVNADEKWIKVNADYIKVDYYDYGELVSTRTVTNKEMVFVTNTESTVNLNSALCAFGSNNKVWVKGDNSYGGNGKYWFDANLYGYRSFVWAGKDYEVLKNGVVEHHKDFSKVLATEVFTDFLKSDVIWGDWAGTCHMRTLPITAPIATKNLRWYKCVEMTTPYITDVLPTGATETTVTCQVTQATATSPMVLNIKNDDTLLAPASFRCYIDGKFVFGVNVPANYTMAVPKTDKDIYLSLLDNRSKSVISPTTGDKVGEIMDYAKTANKTKWGDGTNRWE